MLSNLLEEADGNPEESGDGVRRRDYRPGQADET